MSVKGSSLEKSKSHEIKNTGVTNSCKFSFTKECAKFDSLICQLLILIVNY